MVSQRWDTGEEIEGFESENYLKITVFPTQNSEVRILLALFSVSLNITLPRFFLGYLLILTYVFLALSASYTVIFNLRFREESDIA